MRCGWDVKIKEQWRIKNCNLQSGAVLATLALRALFLVIRRCDFSRTPFVIVSEQSERGNQTCQAFRDVRLPRALTNAHKDDNELSFAALVVLLVLVCFFVQNFQSLIETIFCFLVEFAYKFGRIL